MSISLDKILAAAPATTRGQPTQLSADLKGERIAYASGKSVFIRSIDTPSESKQYVQHTSQTTVARFSPSGYYIASGDVSGQVKVWDSIGAENTKGTYPIISGPIRDIAWDGDSQRIIAVGEGRERFGHCITADSGNSVGEISGHSSVINSVSIRQQRPLRAATGSDDQSLCFLTGVPFKFQNKVAGCHKGYVYGVAFSPDGEHLVSVGADKRIQLYDGKSGEPTRTISEFDHSGSIFGVSWSADSQSFVTCSADQTIKIWTVEGACTKTWRFGEGVSVPDHQVGVVWPAGRTDGLIISISLAGDLNYLYPDSETPKLVVQGHNRSITAAGYADGMVLTGSFEGKMCAWDISSGAGQTINGSSHTNQISGSTSAGGRVYSVGWDDTLRIIDTLTKTFLSSADGGPTKLSAQPRGIVATKTTVTGNEYETLYVATHKGIDIFDAQTGKEFEHFDAREFTPVAIGASEKYVAISDESGNVHIFTAACKLTYRTLVPERSFHPSTSPVTTLKFSPRGTYLAIGTQQGKIQVWATDSWTLVTDRWSSHTAKIMAIDWNEEETHAVSGSLDTNVHLWSLEKPGSRIKAANAHKEGVNGVVWTKEGKVVSMGGDGAVKVWDAKL